MVSGIAFNPNMSISVDKAVSLYNVSKDDLKILNADGDDKITVKELQSFGFNKYKNLTEYFNSKSNGALFASVSNKNNFGNSMKSNFMTNYNSGQLTPRVDSDYAETGVGKTLPMLYA